MVLRSRTKPFTSLTAKFHIDWRTSTVYNPQANGLVEAFNKTLCKLMVKLAHGNKRTWEEKKHEALWAYRTVYKMPTGCSPFYLVYGAEAVIPIEVELPSYRVAIHYGLEVSDGVKLEGRLEELANLEGERLEVYKKLQVYQVRMTKAFDKLVRERTFKKGDLVMVKQKDVMAGRSKGKFVPNWLGPFIIHKVYKGGAYTVVDHEGDVVFPPLNGKHMKLYYASDPEFHNK